MAIKKMDFKGPGTNGEYICGFMSEGPCIVHLKREKAGVVSVRAAIPPYKVAPIAQLQNPYTPDCIFQINIPAGIGIEIASQTEVTEGQIMDIDQ